MPQLICAMRNLFLLATAILVGCTPEESREATRMMVAVEGIRLRVEVAGLEGRRGDEPVVVFESGAGTPLENWNQVLPAVARIAPVVAYDRPGVGLSEWDGEPPTLERAAARLRELLSSLGIESPLVLVGHSWGGALIREFAARYPEDVAGLIFIDPTDIAQSSGEIAGLYSSAGADEAAYSEMLAIRDEFYANSAPGVRAEGDVISAVRAQARSYDPLPAVPTTIVLSGKIELPARVLDLVPDTEVLESTLRTEATGRLEGWLEADSLGEVVVAEEAGHFVHVDDPHLVVKVISNILARASGSDREP